MTHCHILVPHHVYVHGDMKGPIFPLFNHELCKILRTETEIIDAAVTKLHCNQNAMAFEPCCLVTKMQGKVTT
jgi:hypothetical protein